MTAEGWVGVAWGGGWVHQAAAAVCGSGIRSAQSSRAGLGPLQQLVETLTHHVEGCRSACAQSINLCMLLLLWLVGVGGSV